MPGAQHHAIGSGADGHDPDTPSTARKSVRKAASTSTSTRSGPTSSSSPPWRRADRRRHPGAARRRPPGRSSRSSPTTSAIDDLKDDLELRVYELFATPAADGGRPAHAAGGAADPPRDRAHRRSHRHDRQGDAPAVSPASCRPKIRGPHRAMGAQASKQMHLAIDAFADSDSRDRVRAARHGRRHGRPPEGAVPGDLRDVSTPDEAGLQHGGAARARSAATTSGWPTTPCCIGGLDPLHGHRRVPRSRAETHGRRHRTREIGGDRCGRCILLRLFTSAFTASEDRRHVAFVRSRTSIEHRGNDRLQEGCSLIRMLPTRARVLVAAMRRAGSSPAAYSPALRRSAATPAR